MSNLIEIDQPKQVVAVNQPMQLLEMAIQSNADVEKLEKLMALQERWNEQQAKKSFLSAMANFQSKCPDIVKAKQGHNYKYAPLSDIITQVRGLLADSGLSYRFEQSHDNHVLSVTCIISHVDGHSEKTTMIGDPDTSGSKNAIQAVGSAVQYLMRYTFVGALGIATADEDMDGRVPDQTSVVGQDEVMELVSIMCDEHGNLTAKGQKLWTANKLKDWNSITEKQYAKVKQMAGVK